MPFDWKTTRAGQLLLATLGMMKPEDRALASFLPQFTPAIPAGALTSEARVTFTTTSTTESAELKFSAPALLHGLLFTMTPVTRGGGVLTLDELDCNVEMARQRRYLTSQRSQEGVNLGFVTSRALDVRTRLLQQPIPDVDATLTFSFQAKYAPASDTVISVTAIWSPLDEPA